MPSLKKVVKNQSKPPKKLLFERVMAFVVLANFGLVIFDLSYIYARNFWLQGNAKILGLTINIPLPPITKWYDPVKGIEPYRETTKYLEKVSQLEQQVDRTGLQSPEAEKILAQLRTLSTEMIDTNPFAVANKTGTLEKIKNRMRRHIKNESAKESFKIFWSSGYLTANGSVQEIEFFHKQIKPLIATNYFRPVGEDGEPVDFFFEQIDWIFFLIFSIEFVGRVIYISRTQKGVTWRDAIIWRCYDIFLLLPFWRWLRVIPLYVRFKQAKLGQLDRLQQQINQIVIANFAEEIIEIVVVGVINQIQDYIERGDLREWLTHSQKRPYIDLNNTDEVAEISNIVTKLAVYRIFPKIQPDLEALLRHNIDSILQKLPAYRNLQNVPGLANLPKQLTDKLVAEISLAAYEGLTSAIEDPIGAKLSNNLVNHLGEAIAIEVQNQNTIDRIQTLLTDMLEEIKINYIQSLSQEDMEHIIEQTRQLRQITKPQEVKITPYRQI